jgi:hypothetical protein
MEHLQTGNAEPVPTPILCQIAILWRMIRAQSLIRTSELPQWSSVIKINPNSEKLCPEQANCPSIAGGTRQLTRQPALALSRIVVGEKMCGACVPAIP